MRRKGRRELTTARAPTRPYARPLKQPLLHNPPLIHPLDMGHHLPRGTQQNAVCSRPLPIQHARAREPQSAGARRHNDLSLLARLSHKRQALLADVRRVGAADEENVQVAGGVGVRVRGLDLHGGGGRGEGERGGYVQEIHGDGEGAEGEQGGEDAGYSVHYLGG